MTVAQLDALLLQSQQRSCAAALDFLERAQLGIACASQARSASMMSQGPHGAGEAGSSAPAYHGGPGQAGGAPLGGTQAQGLAEGEWVEIHEDTREKLAALRELHRSFSSPQEGPVSANAE